MTFRESKNGHNPQTANRVLWKMGQVRSQVLPCGQSPVLPPTTQEIPTLLGPPQPLGYWCSSASQRSKGEKQKKKDSPRTRTWKSSHAEQVGVTVGHQAPVHAFMFHGHSLDGDRSLGGRWGGIIVEKPGIVRRWVRGCFHREGHSGALCHLNHSPAGYTRIHLDLEWVRTIWKDKNEHSRSDFISSGSLRPQESINTTISLLSTQALGQLQRRCQSLMEMKCRPDPWVKRDCRTHLKRASKCSFLAPTQARFCSKHLKG